jgi:hypothetical protein
MVYVGLALTGAPVVAEFVELDPQAARISPDVARTATNLVALTVLP